MERSLVPVSYRRGLHTAAQLSMVSHTESLCVGVHSHVDGEYSVIVKWKVRKKCEAYFFYTNNCNATSQIASMCFPTLTFLKELRSFHTESRGGDKWQRTEQSVMKRHESAPC